MAGTSNKRAERPSRWVAAERRSAEIRDNGIGEALRIYYTRYLAVGVPTLLALGTAGAYLLFDGGQSQWAWHLQFGVFLMFVGCWIGGWAYNSKRMRPTVELGWGKVMIALNKTDQKSVRRQIAGHEPIDREHLTVVRAAAVQLREENAAVLLYLPCSVVYFAPAIRLWWYAIPAGILILAFAYVQTRDFRRLGRFLQETNGLT